ncbi:N-acetylglucosamine-6-phosphate deacetylase [Hymenobacter latericus]|uniref:N-acetylglucosamine-6-phosphate deacetylase n=1 Tax=Hymenobacter sp. YIM 151858-1 TaxID=2987688 RepID=UPI002225EE66|nr:N-acetylglucosamine-6-phosphate deacetylase [Hymenobacter sp. YIM 151858-1]UYZ57533.1 N-acetylglucosamine-6-phosphate deacetylase [Hymenobacter sp. YIM 151858-1]
MRYALTNAVLHTGHAELLHHAVVISHGRIEGVVPAAELPADVPARNLGGLHVAPGLIDLQVYGADGVLFSTHPTPEVLARMQETFWQQGTTHFLATMPTNSPVLMREAVLAGKAFREQHPNGGLLGVHLEGPYISHQKKGAHQAAFIRVPDVAELREWLHLGAGALRMLTMAPEAATPEAVALLRDAGVVLSAGHTNATYAQATAAFGGGFAAATHLFNAMSGLAGREPGVVGAVYDSATACASIIADGVHCDFAAVRISHKLMGERLFLITDAVAESPEGAYQFRHAGDRYVDGQGTLAGSALTMLQAVRNCVQHAGLSLAESLRMASLYPARVLGLENHLGLIAPGYEASLCVFDDDLEPRGVVLAGELRLGGSA